MKFKCARIQWWLPKVICLIAACLFWVYVMNEQNPLVESSYTVPIEVRNLDRSLVAINVPKKVNLKVRMNRNDLMRLSSDDIKAYVDLRGIGAGEYPNTPIRVALPGEGEVISEVPSVFDLVIDTYAVKSVPVTVQFFGDPAKGFNPVMDKLVPASVTIAGSNTSVSAVDRAVVSIDVSGKKEDFTEFESVNVLDAEGRTVKDLEVVPAQIKASVTMKEEQRTATLPLRVSVTGTPMTGYKTGRVVITPSSAAIAASMSALDTMRDIQLGTIDVSGAEEDVTKVMRIPAPDGGVSVPQNATVTVEIIKDGAVSESER